MTQKDHEASTYSRTREIVLERLKEIGLNLKQFGLHSLQAGGATSAANNGVLDRLLKRHGLGVRRKG